MKLPYFRRQMVARLRAEAAQNLNCYGPDPHWLETFAGGQRYLNESEQVVDPPPELVITEDENAGNDAENAKKVYTWLQKLTPVIAMEERLWSCLAHETFAKYMHARWKAEDANIVKRRYLFEDRTFAALCRHGIARLWWAGYLTHDTTRANPFELTETLFIRQDVQVSLLERSLGKCGSVRTAVLEFLLNNKDWFAEKKFGRRIQRLLLELNLLGGVAVLDAVPPAEIQTFLQKVGKKLAAEDGAPSASAT